MVSKTPVYLLAAALAGVTIGSFSYVSRERAKERQLAATNDSLSTSLTNIQQQFAALSQKVADLSVPKPEPAPPSQPKAQRVVRKPRSTPIARAPKPGVDPRVTEMQAQLADQRKQIAGTREDLDRARDELNGRLDSTRDDLSTTIAKNHDELVELQKRGERTFYEFQLDKSKNFDRVGPIRVSLRKADVKHKRFDMNMLVDDNQLQKKNVNLYEPVWMSLNGESVELVVNQVAKDHIAGYISEPRYRKTNVRATADSSRP
jgi:hypothetical protein